MSWLGWAVLIIVAGNAVFFGILIAVDLIRNWRWKHENSGSGGRDYRAS